MRRICTVFFLLSIIFFAFTAASKAADQIIDQEKIREKEKKITENISEQVEKQIPGFKDQKAERELSLITENLRPHMSRGLDYEVRIIEREDPHAFSLPGGLTYITSGMLRFLRSDDERAAVLAREFVHSDRSHWLIQSARNERLGLTKMAEVAAATQSGKVAGGVIRSYLNRAVINFYDSDLERETDIDALEIMSKAGYNRVAMLTFLERMRTERLKQIYVKGIDIHYRSDFQPLESVLGSMKFLGVKNDGRDSDLTHPDMVRVNTDMEKRVEFVLEYLKQNNIEIKRKYVVSRLLTEIKESDDELVLMIDDNVTVRAKRNEGDLATLKRYKTGIDGDLQLETPPFDIRVQGVLDGEALLVGGRPLIYRDDLGKGEPDLSLIRGIMIKVLRDARRENFLTDYYD